MPNNQQVVSPESALKGREQAIPVTEAHFVNQSVLTEAPSTGQEQVLLGMGCFWGAERLFWQLEGVVSTSVGYSGGFTPNPNYEEVCSGQTGHAEVVRVVFDTSIITLEQLLSTFWENHDPTQGMKQGNDVGTQYRSAIYTFSSQQLDIAEQSKLRYQQAIAKQEGAAAGSEKNVTTEIALASQYYFAETYHQQYLAKNPNGYCGLGGIGVCFPSNG
jgi:peptide-methionine (S)-S-oxide reductase